MGTLTDHNRWLSGCRHVSNNGTHLTPGDIVHCGLGDYVESMRCPNGLPVDRRTPDQVPAWRRRVEKARRDIVRIAQYFEHKDRLIWDALNDTETDVCVVQRVIVSEQVESEFEKRQRAFVSLVESFEMLKGNI